MSEKWEWERMKNKEKKELVEIKWVRNGVEREVEYWKRRFNVFLKNEI